MDNFVKEGEKYRCKCGSLVTKSSIYTHLKTIKHRSFINEIEKKK